MKQRRVTGVLAAVLMLHSLGAWAQPQEQGPTAAAAAHRTRVSGEPSIPASSGGVLPPALVDLDRIVAAAMQQWPVPGIAVAIIADGEFVLSKGYGYRHAESGLPVTAETLFPVASLTKAFTAALVASLVDEGALEWDRPVIEYLPDFRLHDAALTAEVTPRDLLTHQSGLPRHDFVWYGTDLSTRELYERLRFLEPSELHRGRWQYQNLMFMTAGYLASRTTGTPWQQQVRQRIFAPLRMDDSTFSLQQLKERANIALPYAEGNQGARRVPFRGMDAVGAAGSINASADELGRFVLMLLNEGSFEGKRVLSPAVVRAMTEPQVALPADAFDASIAGSSYGLGLVLSEYGGVRLAHHEGGVDGFVSLMSFLPDAGIGVVVLTNYSGDNPLPWIVTRSIYDRLLQQERTDWIAHARQAETPQESENGRVALAASPIGSWRQGLPRPMPADYVGTYWHPAYGQVDILFSDAGLTMRFHGIDAEIESVGRNRFRIREGSLSGLRLTFFCNATNRIDRVAIPWEPEVSDIVFVRRASVDNRDEGGGS